ncbi:hypothetical protein RHMOL_Rhmol07G0270500 [Rhododendron molle]|uniref:Uncharacterized protein n=1 Tax=Rhododendron molle TaxID=49168 RepID=A0ACC0N677_RHOML|nr:hypothetical protein RHMOL_Rhmol07G0270500 [Rhododendron molle]
MQNVKVKSDSLTVVILVNELARLGAEQEDIIVSTETPISTREFMIRDGLSVTQVLYKFLCFSLVCNMLQIALAHMQQSFVVF